MIRLVTSGLIAFFFTAQVIAQKPAFDVISIKPTPPAQNHTMRFDYCQPNGRFTMLGTPVFWSLAYAFQVRDFQVADVPDWVSSHEATYDIEAKAADPISIAECRGMVRSLFEERFKLKTHREPRESAVYFLTVGKGGSKLVEDGAVRFNGAMETLGKDRPLYPHGLTMSRLAEILSNYADRPVVDRTQLTGSYGIHLDFSQRDDDGLPSLFTAVQEQLGLKLEPGRAPVEMLVIDHIEKPSVN